MGDGGGLIGVVEVEDELVGLDPVGESGGELLNSVVLLGVLGNVLHELEFTLGGGCDAGEGKGNEGFHL